VAAVPLVRVDRCVGVLIFASREKRHFDRDGVALMRRMAENVVFALDNFEREAERKRGEERIQYLATHDTLTGLPNRTLFNQVLSMAVESARRYGRGFAVMFIDLDRFKIINDSLGHDAGDMLLREMARRLTHCLRASDVVARIGGDEFVALVQEAADEEAMAMVARKILAAAIEPLEILGRECRVTASIGIARFPDHAADSAALLKNADMAMYQAKEDGKNNFRFYSPDIEARSLERVAIETQLRQALEKGELSLAYQAKTSLATGGITGVEALLRWHNPELGEVTPTRLIPVAEETGLIIPIGRWVLETACARNVAWQREGLRPVSMAVNLSPVQFTDPGVVEHVEAVLRDTGMAPELLELEITESVVMHDTHRAAGILKGLKQLGVRIAIDDFGTGYASLSQLRRFPIDSLKVDRSFVRELAANAGDRSIARAIIAMGRSLSLTVIAEGVETVEQQEFLRSQACDEMQGFYFSRPVPAEAFARLLRDSSTSDPG